MQVDTNNCNLKRKTEYIFPSLTETQVFAVTVVSPNSLCLNNDCVMVASLLYGKGNAVGDHRGLQTPFMAINSSLKCSSPITTL